MTPTTLPEEARIVAGLIALGEHIAFGRDTELLMQLADRVDVLTKERDSLDLEITGWKADQKENLNNQCDMADKVMGQARLLQQARIERDAALKQNTILDAKLAKLEAAAKLALDALDEAQTYADNVGKALDEAQKYAYNVGKYMHGVPQAIETLKQAVVQ